jgi:thiamine pyrophosphate-dependent acetolactate synthase large subunit-like protein
MELKLPPSLDAGETLTGAEIVIRCLKEEGVEFVFGYPGGAVLHIYDAIFNQAAAMSFSSVSVVGNALRLRHATL